MAYKTGRELEALGLQPGDIFPDDRFTILGGDVDRSYLGLKLSANAFSLNEIPTEYILLVMYDQLCVTCQLEVETFKTFYDQYGLSSELGKSLKIVGLDVGSTNRATVKFRRKNKIIFPLVADQRREMWEELGRPELPVVYLIENEGEFVRALMIHHGNTEGPDELARKLKSTIKSQ